MHESDALAFMEKIEGSDELWKLFNMKRVPIIEFSLENAQKVLKHERVLSSVKGKRDERKKGIMEERAQGMDDTKVKSEQSKKLNEVKKVKKDQITNNKRIVKLRLAEIEAGTLKPTPKQVDDLVELAHGRGPRQRLRQRLVKLGIIGTSKGAAGAEPETPKVDFAKQRKFEIKMMEENKEKYEEMMKEKKNAKRHAEMLKKRMPEEERAIAKQVKGKKKAKAKGEATDEFDELADNYVNKKVKTAKWFS